MVNVSDIAAMAASPRFALCALTLSDASTRPWVMELFGGMREACDEHALCAGRRQPGARAARSTVAVTVTGEVAPGRAVDAGGRAPGRRRRHGIARRRGGRPRLASATDAAVGASDERDAIRPASPADARVGEAQVLARPRRHRDDRRLATGSRSTVAPAARRAASGARVRARRRPGAGRRDASRTRSAAARTTSCSPRSRRRSAGAARRASSTETFGTPLTEIGAIVERAGLLAVGADGAERAAHAGRMGPLRMSARRDPAR